MNARKKAFVVETDPNYADTISIELKKSGFNVRHFTTGSEVLHQLSVSPDLIVLDSEVDEKQNGLQFVKTLKNTMPDTQILFISGKNDSHDVETALDYGASYSLKKDSKLPEKLSLALDQIDVQNQSRFTRALTSFRNAVLSLYNF
jgi:DNA-binding response OmpR family regulator